MAQRVTGQVSALKTAPSRLSNDALSDELPILIHFETLLHWSFDRCAAFPKILRPTLTHRFQTHLLDALEQFLELRYTRQRAPLFRRVNLTFETLRFLYRALHERRTCQRCSGNAGFWRLVWFLFGRSKVDLIPC